MHVIVATWNDQTGDESYEAQQSDGPSAGPPQPSDFDVGAENGATVDHGETVERIDGRRVRLRITVECTRPLGADGGDFGLLIPTR